MARIYPNRPFRFQEVSQVDYDAYLLRQRKQAENPKSDEAWRESTKNKNWDEKRLRWVEK